MHHADEKSTPVSSNSTAFPPLFAQRYLYSDEKTVHNNTFFALRLLVRPFLPNFAHKHVSKAPHPPS